MSRFDRRRFLEVAGSATAGVALGSAGTIVAVDRKVSTATIPFYGDHQAGIATPAQDRLVFATYDVVGDRREAQALDADGCVARRRIGPAELRRRPLRAGMRQRSTGRLPRGAQLAAHRPRRRRAAVAALGFGRTSTTDSSQSTPRNLQGFKDGTNNLKGDDHDAMNERVWVRDDLQPWMNGGTYLVSRRIRMFIETWDRSSLQDQEQTIGRVKESGAPLGKTHEHDNVDLSSTLISADAHIRLASPKTNGGEAILRRGYSYTDGVDYRTGELDAGLFFICFQRNPHTQFAAVQRRLGANDALTEYIQHTSSGLFALPRGLSQGESVGNGLFS